MTEESTSVGLNYDKIGFIQGRLSPIIDGKIQAFPSDHWQQEFEIAAKCGFRKIEWTLDQDGLRDNPFLTDAGQEEIRRLKETYEIAIPSVTGDCLMQAPFFKVDGSQRKQLLDDFHAVIRACGKVDTEYLVFPLVDNSHIDSREQEDALVQGCLDAADILRAERVKVAFESDLPPAELRRLMERFPSDLFFVNYDIGNSAALGHNPGLEFAAYGSRIANVHVKDRPLGGTTVPLGEGDADFDMVFGLLEQTGYEGNYILQTARASDTNHKGVLSNYRELVAGLIKGGNNGSRT